MSTAERLKLLEEQLRVSNERLAMVVAASADPIWDYDLLNGTVWWNPRYDEVFGKRPSDTADSVQWWIDHVHEDDRSRVVDSLNEAIKSRDIASESWEQEYRYRCTNGEYAYIADRAFIARNSDGEATRVLGVMHDITLQTENEQHRRSLEAQIQQAQKLESLGVLAGGIAHDFNNLLMGILGNSDLVLFEVSPSSSAVPYIENIQETTSRASDLCKQMLAYSGKGKFVVKTFNLNELVEEMVRLLEVSISKSAILNFNLSEYLPGIEGDLTQIRQVVMNLVTNASEAIGDKSGIITITTGVMEADPEYLSETYLSENLKGGAYAYLEVSDTGCGMEDATVAKIFDPFFSTKFSGRGLGLAAVLGIMRGHHGAFKVYTQLGKGTTMKVLFPCTDQPCETLLEESSPASQWRGTGTVLVVDDEETVRTVSKRMLEKCGFTVLTASHGGEAIDLFRSHLDETVAVLLDLTMPHLGGEDTFRELRRIKSDVRVMMMSGYNEQEVTSRFSGKGLAGFIQKPFGQRLLIESMHKILQTEEKVAAGDQLPTTDLQDSLPRHGGRSVSFLPIRV